VGERRHRPSCDDDAVTAPDTFQASSTLPARVARDLRTDVVISLVLVAASAVLGVLMGLLWHWLAPKVPLYADTTAIYLQDPEGEQAIGADGTFALIGMGAGLVLGALAYWRTRRREGGVAVPIGLTLGGLLGAYVAMKVGIALGPSGDIIALAKSVPTGHTFDGPLKLTAYGVMLAWPFAALAALLALTAVFTPKPTEPPTQPATELPAEWRTPAPDGPETP